MYLLTFSKYVVLLFKVVKFVNIFKVCYGNICPYKTGLLFGYFEVALTCLLLFIIYFEQVSQFAKVKIRDFVFLECTM